MLAVIPRGHRESMTAETAESTTFEKVHRATDSGRAACGTTRHLPEQPLRLTPHDKAVTCIKCLRMLRIVDRAKVGVGT
jgi:hypothetical protein